MKYLANDGKTFDSEEACREYEENLINYDAVDNAIITLTKDIGVYIPLKKKLEIKRAIIEVLIK